MNTTELTASIPPQNQQKALCLFTNLLERQEQVLTAIAEVFNKDVQQGSPPEFVLFLIETSDRLSKIKCTPDEILRILQFLVRFCHSARIYLVELFVRARTYKHRKPLEAVLQACEGYDRLVWQYSSPDRYGDPDDVGCDQFGHCRGASNASAIAQVYIAIDLPFPKGIH